MITRLGSVDDEKAYYITLAQIVTGSQDYITELPQIRVYCQANSKSPFAHERNNMPRTSDRDGLVTDGYDDDHVQYPP